MPAESLSREGAGGWNLLAMSNDNPRKILGVAILLCLVCAVLVAGASVLLKPLQERNKALAIKQEIVAVAGLATPGADAEQLFRERIETHVVDLDTGEYAAGVDPATFDPRAAARDPVTSRVLPRVVDIAGIKRRASLAPVYLVRDDGQLSTIVLPVHGYGLWSTMYGFIALAGDARTIKGITFYEHAETPGLGDTIEQPEWQAQFRGKLAYDTQGDVAIRVIKGQVDPGSPQARYEVDGIAGATLTSNGVTNLLRFWLGDQGFGPYLERLRARGDSA
jgi:Na+-transporting NADH:ubiquinone oxidoreductase subunit C